MGTKRSDSMTLGFALFAMFFGAGNLIFPPFLGFTSGGSWPVGFLCFLSQGGEHLSLTAYGNVFRFEILLRIKPELAFRQVPYVAGRGHDLIIRAKELLDRPLLGRGLHDDQISFRHGYQYPFIN